MKTHASLITHHFMSKHAESAGYGLLLAMLASPLIAAPIAPGDLLVTRSVYQGTVSTVTVGQALPGGGTGVVDGSYPFVWSNEGPDPSFGVSSPIFVDEVTKNGELVRTIAVDPAQVVTSFSSKSELALNLSLGGTHLTFMGYIAPANALDVSNANTPGHVDPTNPVHITPVQARGDATRPRWKCPRDAGQCIWR